LCSVLTALGSESARDQDYNRAHRNLRKTFLKIVILGAGQVGSSLADSLVSENNDITVVDLSPDRLKALQDLYDLRTIVGSGAQPNVLERAGAEDADLLIAVTQWDEVNLTACKIAHRLFNVPTRIARVRSVDYQNHPELLSDDCFAVTHAICPEQIVTEMIRKLLEFPEALQVQTFAEGKVSLIAVRAYEGGPLVQHPLKDLRTHMPAVDVSVAAIFRNNKAMKIEPDTIIREGDEVFCLAPSTHVRQVMCELRRMDRPVKRVMIAGGGNIGFRLAQTIENSVDVKLIEHNKARAQFLAGELNRALVLQGDATDEDLLGDENVDEVDMFFALTNDDEANIMAALLAKRMGARKTIAIVNRRSYAELMQGSQIDVAISPAQVSIGSLLEFVRRGDVVAVHSLRRGAAEALEIVAHGDKRSSRVVGRRIAEIEMPKGSAIEAVVRGEQILIAHDETVIEADDHLIIFLANKRMVSKVEKLFQVSAGFF
jgi:trk system potassium uptake protein